MLELKRGNNKFFFFLLRVGGGVRNLRFFSWISILINALQVWVNNSRFVVRCSHFASAGGMVVCEGIMADKTFPVRITVLIHWLAILMLYLDYFGLHRLERFGCNKILEFANAYNKIIIVLISNSFLLPTSHQTKSTRTSKFVCKSQIITNPLWNSPCHMDPPSIWDQWQDGQMDL